VVSEPPSQCASVPPGGFRGFHLRVSSIKKCCLFGRWREDNIFSLAGTTNIRFLIFSSVLLTSLSKERLDRSLPLRGLRSRWHARSFPKQRSLLMDSFRLTQCDIYFLKVPPAFPIHGTRMQTKDKRLWSSISICIQISSFLTDHTFFLSDAHLFTSKFVSLVLTICVKRGSQCYSPMSDWSSWCSSSDG
jgi:hypothetical protein